MSKKMSNLIDFYLTYTKEKINWDKVKGEFGQDAVDNLQKWRRVLLD